MAIAPIDLQAIYANMNNVAKTVSNQQQGAQLAQQLGESKFIQQNAEKAQAVNKAADNEAKSGTVNSEGHQGQQYKQNQKKDSEQPETVVQKPQEIRESYLGQHIDIER